MKKLAPVLVLALASAGLAACGVIGGGGDDTYRVTAYFPRAVALYEEGQVRVLGLPAGNVAEVATEQECSSGTDGPCVRVELDLDESVDLRHDVNAMLVPQSLIGERYVQLFPAYTDEDAADDVPLLSDLPEDERVIFNPDDAPPGTPRRVIIPVEPDEALAALNEFLESLDPEGLGRFIANAEEDLRGNGASVNAAIGGLADLVETFAERDQELASIVDNFDAFTQTMVTRETQIGEIIDSFARTVNVLAQERGDLEILLAGLARVSQDGFDLISEHAVALRTDLDTLSQLGQSLVANLDAVTLLLDAGPIQTDGLAGAYNPHLRATNLVTSLGPIACNVLAPVVNDVLSLPQPLQCCLPIDTVCTVDPNLLEQLLGGLAASEVVVTDVPAGRTPIDDILAVLGSPLVPVPAADRADDDPADRILDGAGAAGRFLRDAAESLAGAG